MSRSQPPSTTVLDNRVILQLSGVLPVLSSAPASAEIGFQLLNSVKAKLAQSGAVGYYFSRRVWGRIYVIYPFSGPASIATAELALFHVEDQVSPLSISMISRSARLPIEDRLSNPNVDRRIEYLDPRFDTDSPAYDALLACETGEFNSYVEFPRAFSPAAHSPLPPPPPPPPPPAPGKSNANVEAMEGTQKENAVLKDRVNELESLRDEWAKERSGLVGELAVRTDRITEVEASMERLTVDYTAAISRADSLAAEVERLEQEQPQLNSEVARLRAANLQLQTTVYNLSAVAAAFTRDAPSTHGDAGGSGAGQADSAPPVAQPDAPAPNPPSPLPATYPITSAPPPRSSSLIPPLAMPTPASAPRPSPVPAVADSVPATTTRSTSAHVTTRRRSTIARDAPLPPLLLAQLYQVTFTSTTSGDRSKGRLRSKVGCVGEVFCEGHISYAAFPSEASRTKAMQHIEKKKWGEVVVGGVDEGWRWSDMTKAWRNEQREKEGSASEAQDIVGGGAAREVAGCGADDTGGSRQLKAEADLLAEINAAGNSSVEEQHQDMQPKPASAEHGASSTGLFGFLLPHDVDSTIDDSIFPVPRPSLSSPPCAVSSPPAGVALPSSGSGAVADVSLATLSSQRPTVSSIFDDEGRRKIRPDDRRAGQQEEEAEKARGGGDEGGRRRDRVEPPAEQRRRSSRSRSPPARQQQVGNHSSRIYPLPSRPCDSQTPSSRSSRRRSPSPASFPHYTTRAPSPRDSSRPNSYDHYAPRDSRPFSYSHDPAHRSREFRSEGWRGDYPYDDDEGRYWRR